MKPSPNKRLRRLAAADQTAASAAALGGEDLLRLPDDWTAAGEPAAESGPQTVLDALGSDVALAIDALQILRAQEWLRRNGGQIPPEAYVPLTKEQVVEQGGPILAQLDELTKGWKPADMVIGAPTEPGVRTGQLDIPGEGTLPARQFSVAIRRGADNKLISGSVTMYEYTAGLASEVHGRVDLRPGQEQIYWVRAPVRQEEVGDVLRDNAGALDGVQGLLRDIRG